MITLDGLMEAIANDTFIDLDEADITAVLNKFHDEWQTATDEEAIRLVYILAKLDDAVASYRRRH